MLYLFSSSEIVAVVMKILIEIMMCKSLLMLSFRLFYVFSYKLLRQFNNHGINLSPTVLISFIIMHTTHIFTIFLMKSIKNLSFVNMINGFM